MSYIPPEIVKEIKKMDLLTYLKNYEPNELVKDSQTQYSTRTHSSLKISNGLWNYFNGGIGGKNAVDYVEKILGYKFPDSIEYILKKMNGRLPIYVPQTEKNKEQNLILPEKNDNDNKVISYLKSRGIDEELIQKCIKNKLIYEEKYYHNVVFIGYDENKNAKYAGCRSTNQNNFKGDATGSNKKYSFKLESKEKTDTIYIFEGAIDLLSFASFLKLYGQNLEDKTLISLAGVYQPAKIIEQSKVPETIQNYLDKHPEIKNIVLCLDNDEAGKKATKALKIVLSDKYKIIDKPARIGKDYNDYLCRVLGLKQPNYIKKYDKERVKL